jgi:hypothetical protein
MTRLCDGATGDKPCPRRNPCEGDCHFNTAGFKRVPDDLLSFSDRLLCGAVWALAITVLSWLIVPLVYVIGLLL